MLLEQVKLLEATIGIIPGFVPGISGVMFLDIGIWIGQVAENRLMKFCTLIIDIELHIHCTVWIKVGKCVKDVTQLTGWQLLNVIISSINCPIVEKLESLLGK